MVPARCWEAFTGESLFSAGRSSPAASMNCDPTIEARRQRNRRFGDFRFCDAKRFAHARSSHIRIAGFRPWRTIGDMRRGENAPCLKKKVDSAISWVGENCQNIQTAAISFRTKVAPPGKEAFFQRFPPNPALGPCGVAPTGTERARWLRYIRFARPG